MHKYRFCKFENAKSFPQNSLKLHSLNSYNFQRNFYFRIVVQSCHASSSPVSQIKTNFNFRVFAKHARVKVLKVSPKWSNIFFNYNNFSVISTLPMSEKCYPCIDDSRERKSENLKFLSFKVSLKSLKNAIILKLVM